MFGVKDWSNLGHKCKPTSKLMVAIVSTVSLLQTFFYETERSLPF